MINQSKLTRKDVMWQGVIFLAISFSAIEAPMNFTLDQPFDRFWHILIDLLISAIFAIDLVINIKHRKRKRRPTFIRQTSIPNDLALTIDIFACIPFDFLSHFFGVTQGMRILSLLKLIRVAKVANIMSMLGSLTVLPRLLRVEVAIICAIIALNWIACGWIYVQPMPAGDNFTNYNQALYWAITTLTTVGYGDITPLTNLSRIYGMIVMIIGLVVYGVVIGNVSRLMSLADRYKEQTREKIHNLSLFMKHYNIPDQLQYAAFSYYNHLFTKRLSDNDTKIISELPNALQADLQTYMNIKLIGGVPAFKLCSHNCLKDIAGSLEQMFYSPGQTIISKGDIGHEMYIIAHGVVEVIVKDNDVAATLHEGQIFGEASLLEETRRNVDVRAQTYCDLYRLNKDDFIRISKKHPELLKSLQKVMTRRSTDRK